MLTYSQSCMQSSWSSSSGCRKGWVGRGTLVLFFFLMICVKIVSVFHVVTFFFFFGGGEGTSEI